MIVRVTRPCPVCGTVARPALTAVLDELLDPHEDTARLQDEGETESAWAAHSDDRRGRQRLGRATLAHASAHGSKAAP